MNQRISLIVLVLLICVGAGWNAWRLVDRERAQQPIGTLGGDFVLTDMQGRSLDSHSLRGSYLFVYFGYSFCPDICPTELQRMTQVLEQMPATTQSRITPIFISIDPERDTPDALKEYIHYFHPRFIALTGTSVQLADVAKKYGVYYQIHKKSPQDKEYPVDHSSYIYVMDKDGAYVSHFTKDTSVEMMVNKLTALIGK